MLRHAFRRWTTRTPLALTAIATLGLGIGTSTAIFSVADGVQWDGRRRSVLASPVGCQYERAP
jgi:hypothetical protein